MSDASTIKMLEAFRQRAAAPMFLAGFFQTPEQNFHNSEFVEMDIVRDDETIAIPIQSIKAGGREMEASVYTNKRYLPAIFTEIGTISAYDGFNREPGRNPFEDPQFLASATRESFSLVQRGVDRIRRSIELMAGQTLQSGTINLADKSGAGIFTENFFPKSSHFPNAGVNWGSVGYSCLTDLGALGEVVRRDGKRTPSDLVFGKRAWRDFLADGQVQVLLDIRRIELGGIRPESRGAGASYKGTIWIDNYEYRMWVYDAEYIDPQTGNHTPYVGLDKVIMLSDGARLDLTYGAIPTLVRPEQRVMAFLPSRVNSGERGIDFTLNAYLESNNKHLKLEIGTRPLTIPTEIDSFGCLTTRV